MHPIVPWPGGKRRLLQHLLPLLSDNPHTCYVEAFAGGAAVLFGRFKSKVVGISYTVGGGHKAAKRAERIYRSW